MISSSPCTTRSGSRGSMMQAANRPATSRRCSTSPSTSNPPSDESWPPSKRAITGLPPTGDRPGSAGVDQPWRAWCSRSAGLVSATTSYAGSRACTMPANPHEFFRLAPASASLAAVASCCNYCGYGGEGPTLGSFSQAILASTNETSFSSSEILPVSRLRCSSRKAITTSSSSPSKARLLMNAPISLSDNPSAWPARIMRAFSRSRAEKIW